MPDVQRFPSINRSLRLLRLCGEMIFLQ